MSRKMPTNVSTLTKEKIRDWINSFDIVLADCDGEYFMFSNFLSLIEKFKMVLMIPFFTFIYRLQMEYYLYNSSCEDLDSLLKKF